MYKERESVCVRERGEDIGISRDTNYKNGAEP